MTDISAACVEINYLQSNTMLKMKRKSKLALAQLTSHWSVELKGGDKMNLNQEQLENLKKLLCEWKDILEKSDCMVDLAFGLCMTGLGEEIKWSMEKIKKFIPMGLMD
jgi:hypothetical protein